MVPSSEDFMKTFEEPSVRPTRSFEGFSEYNENSDSESFHRAVQQAARAAAVAAQEAAEDGTPDPEWYEVTRVRILVGNPNVKVYGVTITSTGTGTG